MSGGSRRRSGRAAKLLLLFAAAPLAGCVDAFLEPEPPDDPVQNFDLLWKEFDRHYAFFQEKGVDWAASYERYRPLIGPGTSDRELFHVVSEMLEELRDGHVDLVTPFGTYGYEGWKDGYRDNFSLQRIHRRYLAGPFRQASHGPFSYGLLQGGPGYVHIAHFGGDGFGAGIDEALGALEGVPAMVVDIRGNGGGSDLNLDEVVGRFIDRKHTYRYFQYRNGPAHDDFTDLIEDQVEPRGSRRFSGPVALLTDRANFSTAEDFVMAMGVLDQVVVVGDTTGGGMGNPIARELPNGWTYRLSRWRVYDARKTPMGDGEGIAPDLFSRISAEDEIEDRDAPLEAALELLIGSGG